MKPAPVVVFNMVQVTARQRLCPPPLLGRMNASIRFVVWGVMPIAALLAGWCGGLLGAPVTIIIGALIRGFPQSPSWSAGMGPSANFRAISSDAGPATVRAPQPQESMRPTAFGGNRLGVVALLVPASPHLPDSGRLRSSPRSGHEPVLGAVLVATGVAAALATLSDRLV